MKLTEAQEKLYYEQAAGRRALAKHRLEERVDAWRERLKLLGVRDGSLDRIMTQIAAEEEIQKFNADVRVNRDSDDTKWLITVSLTRGGHEFRFTEAPDVFPSDELIAQLMLLA